VEYGLIGYTHAGGVDRPLVVWKGSGGATSDVVVPHLNWRGLFGRGTNASGSPTAVTIEWPGFQTSAYHKMGPTQLQTRTWMGSLLEGQRGAGGQMYMRNRYYDPATGQFTQPDPIGIAGGLNVYGFAAGDPVSYSDPYGLCPGLNGRWWDLTDCPPGYFTAIGMTAGAVGGGIGGGMAGAAACSPTGPGAVVCAGGGAVAGAKAGAAGGAFVGSALDAAILLSRAIDGGSGSGESRPERQRGETSNFRHAVRELGLNRNTASDVLHDLKHAAGLGGADNVWINTTTGAVRAQRTGEIIGYLTP
jgi:RHS repeat-associated protein